MAENGGGSEQLLPPVQKATVPEFKPPEIKLPEPAVDQDANETSLTQDEERQLKDLKAQMLTEQLGQLGIKPENTESLPSEITKSQSNIIARFFQWIASLFRFHPK